MLVTYLAYSLAKNDLEHQLVTMHSRAFLKLTRRLHRCRICVRFRLELQLQAKVLCHWWYQRCLQVTSIVSSYM
jgi:hypothetical protein